MNVVDSSGWLEVLTESGNSAFFEQPLKRKSQLVVPTICVFEVCRKINRLRGKQAAIKTAAWMKRHGTIVELTFELSLSAVSLADEHNLPMADSIIYATAKMYDATLWTQDSDFAGLEGVKYKAKPRVKRKQKK